MQTFLPYPNFTESARALDNKRLGKQRVEVYQIARTLLGESKGWRNHPAVRMWRGYKAALIKYGLECCWEWEQHRGFKDTIFYKLHLLAASHDLDVALSRPQEEYQMPPWLGGPIHANHQARLKAKDPIHYAHFEVEPVEENYWPV